ncbi:MAG: Na(+)/H(+) antiporter subunit D [Myxococcota bacterium]
MSELLLHPAVPYLVGAALALALPTRLRPIALLGAPIVSLLLVERLAGMDASPSVTVAFLGQALDPLRADTLGLLFARIFALAGGIALLYGLKERSRLTHAAAMVTVAAGLTVVLAGDLLTLFVAWEVKAVATTVIVFMGGMAGSVRAAQRYFLVHTLGGSVLFVGITAWAGSHGLAFDAMPVDGASGWILAGFALCAAIPPLHAWLTDAYPEASTFGAVVLSAFTTKAAVYALVRGFPGLELLIWVGAAMALYGAAMAVLENDIRRLLAYHIVSQVGFMVCGVGMGAAGDPNGELALNGTSAHAVSHILYKGLLFMSAGAVIHATGLRKLSDLGGLWRHMPWTLALCMVGAFSISGVPLWNGFISKSMVVSAAEYGDYAAAEWMLVAASVGTFLHTGLKLPWFIFFGEDRGLVPNRRVPWNMFAAMGLAAALCTLMGVAPGLLYELLPYPVDYHPYSTYHVVHQLQLLVGTALGFFLLLSKLGGAPLVTREVNALYEGIGRGAILLSRRGVLPIMEAAAWLIRLLVARVGDLSVELRDVQRAPVGVWVGIAVAALAVLVFALRFGGLPA